MPQRPSEKSARFSQKKPHHTPQTGETPNPRLNKAIAQSGLCSRRKADELIFQGKVKVNGKTIVDPACRIAENDLLEVSGQRLVIAQKHVYLMLHKPIQTVSTAYDPEGRTTVLDLLPDQYRSVRLFPIGRLDYFSEGLLLITNDGDLANALMHPSFHLPKTYQVTVRGFVPKETLARMQSGMCLEDGTQLLPVEVHAKCLGHDTSLLTMTLHQGINRQIRRMCEQEKLTILKLVRVAYGPLTLGDLALGKVRELSAQELAALSQTRKHAKRTRPPLSRSKNTPQRPKSTQSR
ncbi:MAG: rRNA pseudouridine synthase [Desulfovibrio sp.]|nr:rRNA pseudouridine synthase [Desulfovibrio sp.]